MKVEVNQTLELDQKQERVLKHILNTGQFQTFMVLALDNLTSKPEKEASPEISEISKYAIDAVKYAMENAFELANKAVDKLGPGVTTPSEARAPTSPSQQSPPIEKKPKREKKVGAGMPSMADIIEKNKRMSGE